MQYPKTAVRYERFWDDGMLKWPSRVVPIEEKITKSPYDLFAETLEGCNIQSKQLYNKLFVRKSNIVLYEFVVNEITFVQKQGQEVIVKSEDELPVFLTFISEGEASKALQRILLILNGYEVVKCNDENLYICASPKKIGIIFN